MTLTLTDFLLARIAEDEAVAQAAVWSSPDPDWDGVDAWDAEVAFGEMAVGPDRGSPTDAAVVIGPFRGGLHMTGKATERRNGVVAQHIARHDPARVLAECEAKRWIVAWCDPLYDDDGKPFGGGGCTEAWWDSLQALALPYADHPDYREEWRP